jgi:hypothetical protein
MSIYIRIDENKIFFRNTKTNNEYTIIADNHFSYNGLLVANVDNAIEYVKVGIKQVWPRINLIKPKIYLLPMKNINEITQTEQYAIIEVIYKAGARELIVIKNENEVDKKLAINKFGDSPKIDNFNINHINRNYIKGKIIENISHTITLIIVLLILIIIKIIK